MCMYLYDMFFPFNSLSLSLEKQLLNAAEIRNTVPVSGRFCCIHFASFLCCGPIYNRSVDESVKRKTERGRERGRDGKRRPGTQRYFESERNPKPLHLAIHPTELPDEMVTPDDSLKAIGEKSQSNKSNCCLQSDQTTCQMTCSP